MIYRMAVNNLPGDCDIKVLTYNMHGFNQGQVLLNDICMQNKYDILFIQEHWLSPAVLSKILNFSENYIGFGISAMEAAVSSGMLRGRPFGGTAILV